MGTVFVQAERLYEGEDGGQLYEWLFEPTELDQVPITGQLSVEDVWPDVDHLIDRCLAAAIVEFTRTLG